MVVAVKACRAAEEDKVIVQSSGVDIAYALLLTFFNSCDYVLLYRCIYDVKRTDGKKLTYKILI
jgi:hypothetical protein